MADVITLNEIEEVKNLVATNNSASTTGTLSQKLTHLTNVTGSTADSGGTISSGSMMSKLNALLNINLSHGSQEYSTAGTYTWKCPDGVGMVYIAVNGSGGGGGGGGGGIYASYDDDFKYSKPVGGASGGIGKYLQMIVPVEAGNSYKIVIGSGGKGGAAGVKGNAESSHEFENTLGNMVEGTLVSAGDGKNGEDGGATEFSNIISVGGGKGGNGGTGGRAGFAYENSFAWSELTSDSKSGGVSSTSYDTFKNLIMYEYEEKIGNDAECEKQIGKYDKYGYSGEISLLPGASSVQSKIGISSGAGGSGGRNGYAGTSSFDKNGTDGSAGANGSDGYMKIFW